MGALFFLNTTKGLTIFQLTSSADKFARMNVGEDATNGMLWELVHTLLKTQSDPICSSLPDSVHVSFHPDCTEHENIRLNLSLSACSLVAL